LHGDYSIQVHGCTLQYQYVLQLQLQLQHMIISQQHTNQGILNEVWTGTIDPSAHPWRVSHLATCPRAGCGLAIAANDRQMMSPEQCPVVGIE
jgi:hypothetical protein